MSVVRCQWSVVSCRMLWSRPFFPGVLGRTAEGCQLLGLGWALRVGSFEPSARRPSTTTTPAPPFAKGGRAHGDRPSGDENLAVPHWIVHPGFVATSALAKDPHPNPLPEGEGIFGASPPGRMPPAFETKAPATTVGQFARSRPLLITPDRPSQAILDRNARGSEVPPTPPPLANLWQGAELQFAPFTLQFSVCTGCKVNSAKRQLRMSE